MKRSRLALGCLAIAFIALLLGSAFALLLFVGYRNAGGAAAAASAPPQVTISSPLAGDPLAVGAPIDVETLALGHEPFFSTELWINGVLASVDAGPSGGVTPFNSDFMWIPAQPGAYLLVARVVDAKQNVASSMSVLVFVLPNEELTQAADPGDSPEAGDESAALVVFPSAEQAGQAAQPPAPPGPDASSGPSQPWEGSPVDWITSLTAQAAPNAPQVVATADGCSAVLSIHDLSNNEEGFRVYRQALNSPAWLEISQLSAQSQNEWITYADSGVPGPLLYYVSAFNSQGESPGNISLANVATANCPPLEEANPMLTVELTGLIPKMNVEQAYCYQSLGGVHWTRWPALGFFTPGEAGFQLEGAFTEILLNDPQGQPVFETLDLRLECWGWIAGKLGLLGQFTQTIDLENVHDLQVELDGLTAEIAVNVDNLNALGFPGQIPFEGDLGDWNPFPTVDWLPPGSLKWPEPETARMPFIQAWVTYDPAFCTAHLEPEAQNILGSLLLCQPYPGFHPGPGGVNPQPYLVWSLLDNTCKAGFNEDCLPMSWWIAYAKAKGGAIGFIVIDYFEVNDWVEWNVSNPLRTMWEVDPNSSPGELCPLEQRIFQVQMVASGLPNYPNFYGPKSNLVKIPCVEPLGDQVTIEVTFETLTLSGIDDDDTDTTGCIGPGSCDDVEVYGTLRARSSSMNAAQKIVFATNDCTNPEAIDFGGFTTGTCLRELSGVSYSLSNMPMCASPCNDWGQGNNSLLIQVKDGDAIKLFSYLTDDDSASDDDPVCVVPGLWTEPKTLLEWAATANETYNLTADHDNTDCNLKVILNAVKP